MNIEELNKRLDEEGFNPQFYCIGPGWHRLGDGFALDRVGDRFEWFYVERGQRGAAQKVFASEDEACRFAYETLASDDWAQSHMIGMFASESEATELAQELARAGIRSKTDRIPWGGPADPRFRVFVYGRDVFKVKKPAE
jgi:hypothetical protein